MALPCLHHLTGRWIPMTERSLFLSATAVGKFVGTGSAMAAAPMVADSWPSIFYLFGVIGIVWVIVWGLVASSEPASCPHIGAVEKAYLKATLDDFNGSSAANGAGGGGVEEGEVDSLLRERELSRDSVAEKEEEVEESSGKGTLTLEHVDLDGADGSGGARYDAPPWRQILTEPALWVVAGTHFCVLWAQYLLISWLPTYFTGQVGLELGASGFILLLPYLSPLVLTPAGGLVADALVRRGTRVGVVRKIMVTLTLLGPAAAFAFLVANPNPSPVTATALSTLAVGMLGFGDSGYWAVRSHFPSRSRFALAYCGAFPSRVVAFPLFDHVLTAYLDCRRMWTSLRSMRVSYSVVGIPLGTSLASW